MKKNFLVFTTFLLSYVVFCQNTFETSNYNTLITSYLTDNKDKYNLTDDDFQSLILTDSHQSSSSGLTHMYLNQAYQGIKIYNAISTVAIKDGKVFYYANRFINNMASQISTTTPSIGPQASISAVLNYFQLESIQNFEQLEFEGNSYQFAGGTLSNRNIPVELVFFKGENSLNLAWDVTVYLADDSHWYNVKVDASDGTILEFNDLILTCNFGEPHYHFHHHGLHNTVNLFKNQSSSLAAVDGSIYNVFPFPTESPNHGTRQIVSNPASPLASPFGWHDDDGITGPEYTITRGNNVWAAEDRDGDFSTIGFSPDGGSALNFDYSLDINQPPSGYEDVAITNLFYANNMMHDIWYHHGFDVSAGNFQTNNYGVFGFGGDFVFADAQDGSGLNNATFGTPPDGQNPVMSMFLWTPSGPLSDPLTINNGTVAGTYGGSQATFGAELSTTPITSNLVLVEDLVADNNDACDPFINAAEINGSIAVIRRGTCQFGAKVLAAENAGALAVIMVNNQPGATINMAPGTDGGQVTIPSIMVEQGDGEAIITAIQNGELLSATLVNNGPFLVDGDFDNGIIAHEYGHGISTRLNSGPSNVSCLFNNEQMGEGWSDWFGLMVTMKASDTENDARGIGTFAISQPTTGNGIRPRRYSPDLNINELTYGVTNNTGLSQPHGIGSVWATVLWDLTWAYIDKYGFDSDLYNGNGGNNRIMRLVLDGLKLQPCSPGFVDGRDALLAADLATTGGQDQCMIWQVFARRGLGFNASQGSSDSRLDQVEDFTMPPANDPSLLNCTTLSINDTSIEDAIKVYPNPTQDKLFIETRVLLEDVQITAVDINGRVVLSVQTSLSNSITLDTSQMQPGLYILNIKGNSIDYNTKLIKN